MTKVQKPLLIPRFNLNIIVHTENNDAEVRTDEKLTLVQMFARISMMLGHTQDATSFVFTVIPTEPMLYEPEQS